MLIYTTPVLLPTCFTSCMNLVINLSNFYLKQVSYVDSPFPTQVPRQHPISSSSKKARDNKANKCAIKQASSQQLIDKQRNIYESKNASNSYLNSVFVVHKMIPYFQSMLLLLLWHSKFCWFPSGGKLVGKPKVNKANRTNDPIISLGQAAGGWQRVRSKPLQS